MNNKERMIIFEAASLLRAIADMRPQNPCDIERIAKAANIGCPAAGRIAGALESLAYPDEGLEIANEALQDVRQAITPPRTSLDKRHTLAGSGTGTVLSGTI